MSESVTDEVGQGGISLPPLHTAVPLAKLDTYRRPKDTSVSPIQEMLFRKSPKGQYHHHHHHKMPSPSPSSDRERERAQNQPRSFAPTPRPHPHTAAGGRPVLSRLTTDLYPTSSHSLKSPRKRGKSMFHVHVPVPTCLPPFLSRASADSYSGPGSAECPQQSLCEESIPLD